MDVSKYSSEGWWVHSGLELKYTEYAMNWASEFGRIEVLDWWLHSGLILQYTENAMHWASRCGCINVLDWWLASGIPDLKYIPELIRSYSENVQKWWDTSGLPLRMISASTKSSRKI